MYVKISELPKEQSLRSVYFKSSSMPTVHEFHLHQSKKKKDNVGSLNTVSIHAARLHIAITLCSKLGILPGQKTCRVLLIQPTSSSLHGSTVNTEVQTVTSNVE
jgi:hypothetical protein